MIHRFRHSICGEEDVWKNRALLFLLLRNNHLLSSDLRCSFGNIYQAGKISRAHYSDLCWKFNPHADSRRLS